MRKSFWPRLHLFISFNLRPPKFIPCKKYTSHPIILSTVKIWRQFRRHFKNASPSPLMPICDNHLFLPSALDPVFCLWKEKGLVNFKELFVDKGFASFDNLKTKFDIPQSHLQYLDIFKSEISPAATSPTLSTNWFWHWYNSHSQLLSFISGNVIYWKKKI